MNLKNDITIIMFTAPTVYSKTTCHNVYIFLLSLVFSYLFIITSMMNVLDRLTNMITKLINIVCGSIVCITKTIALFVVIAWTAIFVYATFYYTYMPDKDVEREVYLQLPMSMKEQPRLQNSMHYSDACESYYMKNRYLLSIFIF